MERIVIEVDPKVALAWRRLSAARRKEIANRVGIRIGKKGFGKLERRKSFLPERTAK
jgi:hypothetical protein